MRFERSYGFHLYQFNCKIPIELQYINKLIFYYYQYFIYNIHVSKIKLEFKYYELNEINNQT